MKKDRNILIINSLKTILLISLVVAVLSVPPITAIQSSYILGAHRGASIDFTENTIEAFQKALGDDKYQYIEFDISYTKDKKIVVMHQNNKFKLPKKFTKIRDYTYEELQNRFDFKIPQYYEVMDIIGDKKPVNIEIKSNGNPEDNIRLTNFLLEDCKQRGIYNKVLISSPKEEIIKYIEDNYPEIKTGKVYWITIASIIPLESFTKSLYDNTTADYILLHGYNLKNYDSLINNKPENKGLIIWYFTDEAYIIQEDECPDVFWEC